MRDGCPMFAPAYSGFPVEVSGVGALHAAFLNESRTRGRWWSPVQEIRIRGPKKMGEAQRPLLPNWRQTPSSNSMHSDHSFARLCKVLHRLFRDGAQRSHTGNLSGVAAVCP